MTYCQAARQLEEGKEEKDRLLKQLTEANEETKRLLGELQAATSSVSNETANPPDHLHGISEEDINRLISIVKERIVSQVEEEVKNMTNIAAKSLDEWEEELYKVVWPTVRQALSATNAWSTGEKRPKANSSSNAAGNGHFTQAHTTHA